MPLFLPRPVNLKGLFSCIVFSDYVHVHRVLKIFIVHGGMYHSAAREYLLNHKWPFVGGSPFAPGITLWQYDALDYQITHLIYLTSELFVESLDHPFLIHLPMGELTWWFCV